MIHVFTYHDHYYIYDTGSGSLHACDEQTANYLSGKPVELTDEELKSTLADLAGLRSEGLLYAEEPTAYPMKSNEVKALCLHVSHDCNLRCKYCFSDHEKEKHEPLSDIDIVNTLEFCRDLSSAETVHVDNGLGGEPSLEFSAIQHTHTLLQNYHTICGYQCMA